MHLSSRKRKDGKRRTEKRLNKIEIKKLKRNFRSIREIPCFYRDCNYQYLRYPGKYAEKSDRFLKIPKELGIARSCKKHKDEWLRLMEEKNGKNDCELCHGLNSDNSEDITIIFKDDFFLLCSYCKNLIIDEPSGDNTY